MLRSTKIVATLGPASSDPAVLERMVRAGVDVVRLNFSHGTAQDHEGRARLVKDIATRTGRTVAILCDLHMPGTDGVALYDRILAERPELASRFVFISGGAHTERARRFLETRRPRLLEKPFSPQRVAETLRKVLRT